MSDNPRMKNWLKQYEESHYANQNDIVSKQQSIPNNNLYNIKADTVNFVNYNIGSGMQYVGFWRRLFAFLIDNIVISILLYMFDISNVFFSLLLISLYFALFTSSPLKASIGKLTIGAIVVDSEGNQISFWKGLARFYASLLSTILLLFGFLMIAFHGQKKSLHDMISGTVVINKK